MQIVNVLLYIVFLEKFVEVALGTWLGLKSINI